MQFEVPFGAKPQRVSVPDRNLLAVLRPPESRPFHDTAASLADAAAAATRFVGRARRVLVLVNDYTRPTPNEPVLRALLPALRERETRYLVCLGTHRLPTESEVDAIFGRQFARAHRAQIVNHDCRDRPRLTFAGRTKFDTDVWLNRETLWADAILTINSIEPHYFAGFTGGRKAFLPGIAGYTTIAQNHNLVVQPGSTTFGLAGNPVHQDMTEAARMVHRPIFSIQLVQDRLHNLLAVRYGDLLASFEQACTDARAVFAVPVSEQVDVVLSVLGSPYDINFYQSQRAVEFARPLLKPHAVQITVSRCYDGIGNDGFVQVFRGCEKAEDVLKCVEHQTRLGWHKSARLAQIMATADLYTVMNVPDEVIGSTFMKPFHSTQDAIDAALDRCGPGAMLYVIPDAGSVVPVLTP